MSSGPVIVAIEPAPRATNSSVARRPPSTLSESTLKIPLSGVNGRPLRTVGTPSVSNRRAR